MLSFCFEKKGDAVFISHIDIMRALHRTLRRMGIPLDYSKGYNPHMLINLSQPLPLGVSSIDEWATLQTDFGDPKAFVELFNKNCPNGLMCNSCHYTDKKPNIAGNVTASNYYIASSKAHEYAQQLMDINKQPLFVPVKSKAGEVLKDVSPMIYSITAAPDGIALRLAFGNINLRIDNLSVKLNEMFGLDIELSDITRTEQLIKTNEEYISVKEYLKTL